MELTTKDELKRDVPFCQRAVGEVIRRYAVFVDKKTLINLFHRIDLCLDIFSSKWRLTCASPP
jgi:hypothetical protein